MNEIIVFSTKSYFVWNVKTNVLLMFRFQCMCVCLLNFRRVSTLVLKYNAFIILKENIVDFTSVLVRKKKKMSGYGASPLVIDRIHNSWWFVTRINRNTRRLTLYVRITTPYARSLYFSFCYCLFYNSTEDTLARREVKKTPLPSLTSYGAQRLEGFETVSPSARGGGTVTGEGGVCRNGGNGRIL